MNSLICAYAMFHCNDVLLKLWSLFHSRNALRIQICYKQNQTFRIQLPRISELDSDNESIIVNQYYFPSLVIKWQRINSRAGISFHDKKFLYEYDSSNFSLLECKTDLSPVNNTDHVMFIYAILYVHGSRGLGSHWGATFIESALQVFKKHSSKITLVAFCEDQLV